MEKSFYVGIDVGGTKILIGSADQEMNILVTETIPTNAWTESKQEITQRLLDCVHKTIERTRAIDENFVLQSIGVGAPGPVDSVNGIVIDAGNLGNWKHVPVVDILTKEFKTPTFLEKDGNLAAIGEYHLGEGKGLDNVIVITVGTGLGSGLILNGKLHTGQLGRAGELGHIVISEEMVQCVCGGYGCLEQFTSGKAMVRMAHEEMAKGRISSLAQFEKLTAHDIELEATKGDLLSLFIIKKAADYLGRGIVSAINLLGPDKIVVGGGVSNLGNLLLDETRSVVRKRVYQCFRDTPIVRSALGTQSGLFGALVHAREKIKTGSN
jgi:glucokinase